MKPDYIELLGGIGYGIIKGSTKGTIPSKITDHIDETFERNPAVKSGEMIGQCIVKVLSFVCHSF